MKTINDFTNLYQLSKTLRFELIPQGKTLENIQKNGFLEKDEHRAETYILVKEIIDRYHKTFIENALTGLKLTLLNEYHTSYQIVDKDETQRKKHEEIQTAMRKEIATCFSKNDLFKRLFSKELIKEDLKLFVEKNEEKTLIAEFDNFTTYFTGFHENRKNIYTDEAISTAISYRLIHQNLPRFIDNMRAFTKIKESPVSENYKNILSDNELGPIVQILNVDDAFSIDFFNDTLSQKGIDVYNQLIGGYTSDDGKHKIKGINEYVNLYNQTVEKEKRIPKLKPLYKQILSDRTSASFIPDAYSDDNEVLTSLVSFYKDIKEQLFDNRESGEHSLKQLLKTLKEFNCFGIYLRNDLGLTEISQKMFGDWSVFQKALNFWYDKKYYTGRLVPETERYEEERRKYFRNANSFSISFLNKCLLLIENTEYHKSIEDYFSTFGKLDAESLDYFEKTEQAYNKLKDILDIPYPKDKNLSQIQHDVDMIKSFLDCIKELQRFIKPLLGKGDEAEKDDKFYGEFLELWKTLDHITPLYNKVRNYMTRKPYSTEKIKLNFDNSTLLDGWDVNKEPDNTCVILRRNSLYYLGIIDKRYNKILKKDFSEKTEDFFEKMEYKLLPGANKMLPKVFFSKSRIDEFCPSEELLQNYHMETHKKGTTFNKQHCHELIDFFKKSINKHEDWYKFGFIFSETQSYDDLSGFYREVEKQGYKVSFRSIPQSYINKMVDEGKLYLFQIYNKDFSAYSKGTPSMHTLYWKMLFDTENLKDVVYKLNGQAEVFYRKKSIKSENITVHKADVPLKNKNQNNEKNQSVFNYDIIKDRRYTVDKFQFHVPITLNFKAYGLNNINILVNEMIKENNDIHIIGIDRGERHLLYVVLINSKGEIIKQFSLNEIVNEYLGKKYQTNYHDLLNKKEGDRDEARRNWKTIDAIKDLKEGYLSQVIHKITELMVQYNAIVVLEDLNTGFKQGRQKVEKSVYQQFEKMLIDKLNFLVSKKKIASSMGGLLNAYQLTNKFESFQKMGKQSGFLFYVPAWNTSKMDPVTGFVNLFSLKYENMEKTRAFFKKFDIIRYNSVNDFFEFVFDYNNFTSKAEGTRTHWTVCSIGERIETFRNKEKNNQWDCRVVNLTNVFKELFRKYDVRFEIGFDIKDEIQKQNNREFYESLLYLMRLTMQMRNSITGTDTDFLISPVAGTDGYFFDSRNAGQKLPQNADANGAYNIARKGLWVIEQIRKKEDLKKIKLAISNKEWMAFIQKEA